MIGSRGQQCTSPSGGYRPPAELARTPPAPFGRSAKRFGFGSRGQQWTVMQMLQGGIIAVLMLVVVLGVVQSAKDQTPRSDIYTISCEILGSAYAARGTGMPFIREALLVAQEIDAKALVDCSGLPSNVHVGLYCDKAYCIKDGESLDGSDACSLHSACGVMEFVAGETIKICSTCKDDENCGLWFGEEDC